MITAKDVAHLLLEIQAVAIKPTDPFTYTSGMVSPIYCDNRLIISYPEKREQIAQAFVDVIKDKGLEFDTIGGPATGAIPHAAWVAEKLGIPMIYIRGKAKGHGKQNQVEGVLTKGQRVLIIEDHISTGGSSLDAAEAVREQGGIVTDCIAISTYEMEAATNGFADAGIQLFTLTNFTALVDAAVETNAISADQQELVLSWNKDPQNWADNNNIA